LTFLGLASNEISEVSASWGLSNLISLTDLRFDHNQIIDVSGLTGLTSLTKLTLDLNEISNVSSLTGLTNLTFLNLDRNRISGISGLSGLTSVRHLDLGSNLISDISTLSGLTDLDFLRLTANQIGDIPDLSGLTILTFLGLAKNQISEVSASWGLSSLISLTDLRLDHNQIIDVSGLTGLTNLTKLTLDLNEISNVAPLSGLTNLTFLNLDRNRISGISGLSGLGSLRHLDLGSNLISDISALSGLTDLDFLRLTTNQISDIPDLSGLTNLTFLGLASNEISEVSASWGLSNLISLTDLRLNTNQITDVSSLTQLFGLRVLNLLTNPLDVFAYCTDLPIIESNNPGISLLTDPNPYSSCYTAPAADAGANLAILSEDQSSTVIQGAANDAEDDPLTYRWLEGGVELAATQPVGPGGEADLDLSTLASLALGEHTLTLEVSDGEETSTDDMILTVGNAAPIPAPTGGGTYPFGSTILLGGQVSDFDGDLVGFEWEEGTELLFDGFVQTTSGDAPVDLSPIGISSFSLDSHTVTLVVCDGVNDPVTKDIEIEVIDTADPTLAPVPDQTILWPPNHDMVEVTIEVNAHDNSGDPVVLTASVTSSEPLDDLGDGSTEADWTIPVIDQVNGLITAQLRAERSGSGDDRVYTISITGTDSSGNSSEAQVEIVVPHSKKKTK
jgi:Leucine-rich repeat (LRR) protein